jgi:hypothetical protein
VSDTESAALALLLEHHPAQLETEEVVRALVENPHDKSARDDVIVALRALTAAGLAHRHGDFWFATVAAVRFEALDPI